MSEITINLHDIPCGNCTVCIGRTIGAKHEQERIIKLLEADICKDWTYTCCDGWCSAHTAAIALIKGEK